MSWSPSAEVFYNNVLKINNRKHLTTDNTDFPYYTIEQLSSFFRKEDEEFLYCIFFDCYTEWQTVELDYFSKSKDYRRYPQYEQYSQFLKDMWIHPLRDDNPSILEWFFCEFASIYFKRLFSFKENRFTAIFKTRKGQIEFKNAHVRKKYTTSKIEEEDPKCCLLRMLRTDGCNLTKAKEALERVLKSSRK